VCGDAVVNDKYEWLMHLNIQGGVINKINDLELLLSKSSVDIVCLNEHFLNAENIKLFSSIPNYKVAGFYCRKSSIHGGSCILLKSNLNYLQRTDIIEFAQEGSFELCGIELTESNILIISIYRTPNKENFPTFIHQLESLLNKLSKEITKKIIFIAGDFNIDVMDCCKFPKEKDLFLNLISQHGLNINFTTPTRITAHSRTCIDNIITNSFLINCEFPVINIELGLSDHRALFLAYKQNVKESSSMIICSRKRRIFSKKKY